MTQDEIIRMAREAGLIEVFSQYGDMHIKQAKPELLERFAALVAAHAKSEQINLAYQQGYEEGSAHEREACAKVCEDLIAKGYQLEGELDLCAAAIRARGEK